MEPYSAILATHSMLEHNHLTMVYQNEALYNIARKYLGIVEPNYEMIN